MKRGIWLNYSKGHFKARKDQVWPIFTHFSILISGQMLPKSIASCSFWGMILVPHYYFHGQKGLIYWAFFKVRKVQFRYLLHIWSIYLFKICLLNILLIGMELLQDSANELWRDIFYWNSKGHFQGQVWLIFTYFCLLITVVVLKCWPNISACSFSNVRNDKMDDKFFHYPSLQWNRNSVDLLRPMGLLLWSG